MSSGRPWTDREHKLLRKLFAQKSFAQLAFLFKRTTVAVKSRVKVLGLKRGDRKEWTSRDDKLLRKLYPDRPTEELVKALGRKLDAIYRRAWRLGLKKSAAYFAGPESGRWSPGEKIGWSHRFPKGHVPANKGLRRPGFAPGRMAETQFKKGCRAGAAQNQWVPVGTVKLNADGYLRRKIADQPESIAGKGGTSTNWEFVHIRVWEDAHGPIPEGHRIWWKDGNHLNCALENLELLNGSEHMARTNMWMTLPRELAEVIQLKGALKRQINKRSKANEEQAVRPAQSPVRDSGSAPGPGEAYGT